MGMAFLPFAFMTILWGGVGIGLPMFLPKGENQNRGLIQLALILTAGTCWLFWLCTYMSQMNPLIGPKLRKNTILMLAQEWGNTIPDL
ncbi:ATPase subunit [Nesidiocoris tenuis]|uniref:V-type proton ATPase subunit n=1 Tax=Nesidiocoris tenuis TaxID=355587 RepID=A0ABN7BGA4_9HEMI|nr:ATPase subunit [Nesidiocoris tenuis]